MLITKHLSIKPHQNTLHRNPHQHQLKTNIGNPFCQQSCRLNSLTCTQSQANKTRTVQFNQTNAALLPNPITLCITSHLQIDKCLRLLQFPLLKYEHPLSKTLFPSISPHNYLNANKSDDSTQYNPNTDNPSTQYSSNLPTINPTKKQLLNISKHTSRHIFTPPLTNIVVSVQQQVLLRQIILKLYQRPRDKLKQLSSNNEQLSNYQHTYIHLKQPSHHMTTYSIQHTPQSRSCSNLSQQISTQRQKIQIGQISLHYLLASLPSNTIINYINPFPPKFTITSVYRSPHLSQFLLISIKIQPTSISLTPLDYKSERSYSAGNDATSLPPQKTNQPQPTSN